MEENQYHDQADLALYELLEFAESLEDKSDIEAELEEGILSITMPDEREYVINKHTPSRQIWVSSPYSGAGYFEYDGAKWAPKRSEAAQGRDILSFIKDEVKLHIDEKS